MKKQYVLTLLLSYLCSCSPSEIIENSLLIMNKDTYLRYEDIYIKTTYTGSDSWIGIFKESDELNDSNLIRYANTNLNGYVPNKYYNVQKSYRFNEENDQYRNFPGGNYKAVLFKSSIESKYEPLEINYFTIKSQNEAILSSPKLPTNVTYELNDKNSGLAGGKLILTFDEKTFNTTAIKMYWGDSEGNKLEDYKAIKTYAIYSSISEIEFDNYMVIPSEAKTLLIYTINANFSDTYRKISEKPYVFPLENANSLVNDNYNSKFVICSDIHIATVDYNLGSGPETKELHTSHLKSMIEDTNEVIGKDEEIVVIGDIANSGQESEWKLADEILKTDSSNRNIYYTMGNHDLYNLNGVGNYSDSFNIFKKYTNENRVYYEVEFDGFHHLILGSESNNNTKGVDADLSDDQLNWLDTKLSQYYLEDNKKPIFVYLHQSLYNTIAGSLVGQGWNGVIQDEQLRNILKKYPNATLFDGHSHWEMESESNMFIGNESLPNKIFNTSSVAYLWTGKDYENATISNNDTSYYVYKKGSEGYYIFNYDNYTLVLGRDFISKKYIPSACYAIIYN